MYGCHLWFSLSVVDLERLQCLIHGAASIARNPAVATAIIRRIPRLLIFLMALTSFPWGLSRPEFPQPLVVGLSSAPWVSDHWRDPDYRRRKDGESQAPNSWLALRGASSNVRLGLLEGGEVFQDPNERVRFAPLLTAELDGSQFFFD